MKWLLASARALGDRVRKNPRETAAGDLRRQRERLGVSLEFVVALGAVKGLLKRRRVCCVEVFGS